MTIYNKPKTSEEWKKELIEAGYFPTEEIAKQVADWASKMMPLYVTGPEFGGKSALVEALIKVLNKKYTSLENETYFVFGAHNTFNEMFYDWNGEIRQAVLNTVDGSDSLPSRQEVLTSSKYVDEGILLRILKDGDRLRHLCIDFYDGNFKDDECDKALANFIEKKEIFITETSETVSLPKDQELFVFVIKDSYKESDNFQQRATSKALENHSFHLNLPELTRHEQWDVFEFICPTLPEKLIGEFIRFIEYFNNMPDADMKVSFGECVETIKMIEESGETELTPSVLLENISSVAKNQYDHERFKDDVVKILKMVRNGEISFSD